MGHSDTIRPSTLSRMEVEQYDDFLADESRFLTRCGITVSRRRLTEALRQDGLGRADAETVVRDYCDRQGILPQYAPFLEAILIVVFVLGFGTSLLLLRDALDIMQHIRSPYDPSRMLWSLRMEEVGTVFSVTLGTLLILGTVKLVLDHSHRRRKRVISDRFDDGMPTAGRE